MVFIALDAEDAAAEQAPDDHTADDHLADAGNVIQIFQKYVEKQF